MPAWDENTPFRTGVPSILAFLRTICRIMTVFEVIVKAHLREDLQVYWDALQVACENFMNNIPSPRA